MSKIAEMLNCPKEWKSKTIMGTYKYIKDYEYESRPFFTNERKESVFPKQPRVYIEYLSLSEQQKADKFKEFMKLRDFSFYVSAVENMRLNNIANREHLKTMIALCDELGEEYSKYQTAFISALNTHAKGN